jgi:DNA mismatch endonuclease, patch repair protein
VDKISKEKRSELMSTIHSKDTKPEVKLRKALFAKACRYRIHYGVNKIDVAFPRKKVAVFVDGCFWHGCPIHAHLPKTNEEYWIPKLTKNKIRDKETTYRLENEGWIVLRFWEHELDNSETISNRIVSALQNR